MANITRRILTTKSGRTVRSKFSDLKMEDIKDGDILLCVRNIGTNRELTRGKRYKVCGFTDKTQIKPLVAAAGSPSKVKALPVDSDDMLENDGSGETGPEYRRGFTMQISTGKFVTFAASRFVKQ